MAAHRSTWILAILLIVHAILAFSFASMAPFQTGGVLNGKSVNDVGTPDEIAHIAYVRHILRFRDVPVLDPRDARIHDTYEHHQPPLYYFADSIIVTLSGVSPTLGPESKVPMRFANILFGMLGVAGTWYFTRWLTHRRTISAVATAIVALLPMNVALSGSVSNDPLLTALCTWALALAVRGVGRKKPDWAIGAGFLAGMAILTKSTGILLLVPLGIAFYPRSVKSWLPFVAAVGIPCLLALPWWARNMSLYGDPLALSAFHATFDRQVFPGQLLVHPRELLHWAYVLGAGSILSFVGIFGYMDIHLPYFLYIPILVLFVAGLGQCYLITRRPDAKRDRRAWVLNTFVVLLTISYVGYNLWQVQPQARYLFSGLAPIALAMSTGLLKLPKGKVVAGATIGLLLLANVYALATLPQAYQARSRPASSADLSE